MDIYYFAYGSNMASERLEGERGVKYTERKGAILPDWHLVFNKISATNPLVAVANIEKKPGSEVRGILYKIDTEDLKVIDKYERAPSHYQRVDVRVRIKDTKEEVNAVTYEATYGHKFGKGEEGPVTAGYFKWLTKVKAEVGAPYVTRMMPQAQLFKNEGKIMEYYISLDEYINEALAPELKTFIGCQVGEPRLAILIASPDIYKYMNLLKKGWIKAVDPPKGKEDTKDKYTWFGLTARGKAECDKYKK